MTINNQTRSISVDGDGLTTVFNYDFYMGGSANYAVLVYTDSDGISETVDAADFSITGVTAQAGGTFTYPLTGSPIAAGTSLTLSRVVPLVQSAAIANQGNFYPSVVEGALDYQMMALQQLGSGSLTAETLFGNPTSLAAPGQAVSLGSGLSFSGTALVVSGISGSGTVTEVNTGTGLTGGPITGVGTISMSSISASSILANATTASAVPTAVTLGAGLSFTGSTLQASGGLTKIATITASVVTASFDFPAIAASGADLIVMIHGRTATASTSDTVLARINNDSGANYNSQRLNANNTTVAGAQVLGATSWTLCDLVGQGGTASFSGQIEMVIGGYTGAVFYKTHRTNSGLGIADATGNTIVQQSFGLYKSTATITQVTVLTGTGTGFVTGSTAVLYARG